MLFGDALPLPLKLPLELGAIEKAASSRGTAPAGGCAPALGASKLFLKAGVLNSLRLMREKARTTHAFGPLRAPLFFS